MLSLIVDIYGHMSSHRKTQFILVLVLMLIGSVAEIFTLGAIVPFLGLLVNPGIADQQPLVAVALDAVAPWVGGTRLAAASLWFALFAVLAAVLRLTLNWVSIRFVFAVGADFGEAIYSRVLQQPYRYHIERNSSQTLAAIDKVGTVVMGLMAPMMQAGIAAVMVCAIFGAMLVINPTVALGAGLTFGCIYLGISVWAKRRLRVNGQVVSEKGTLKIKALQEGLGAIRDVIIDGNHAVYTQHFSQADREQRMAQSQNMVLANSPKYVVESIGMVLFVLLAMWMSNGTGGVSNAIPTLGALAMGAQRLLPYMQNIYTGFANARGSVPATEEVIEMLNLQLPKSTSYCKIQPMSEHSENTTPVIELRKVCFTYSANNPLVLRDVNITIPRGARMGFVGTTGSGKSTLIDLIMGLLTPTSGEIYVSGQLLSATNMSVWQRSIAHVPQAIFLKDSSLAENIALGTQRDEIDIGRLESAIRQSQLLETIHNLPKGIETRVGERGVQLSGGQRQRIGIARALYKNAEILILDEATSALDNETERNLMDSIYQTNPSAITLMIAHRLSTLDRCDSICTVRSGEVYLS
jgi:ATP-binding cassette, subfamily B, bacterial PglK